jgi:hypothetical protein
MRGASLAAGCLICAFCLQALLTIPWLSATADEPIHIASGYSHWKTRDFRMEPDTPPTRPEPGVHIISAHKVIRMRQVDSAWRTYRPVDKIGESLWVYRF